jgi:divalent metal cation (Fe/Co/Zn/Cd) transporter
MDAVDPALLDRVEHAIEHAPGVAGIADLRLRWIGHRLAGSATIAVAATTLAEAADVAAEASRQVRSHLPNVDVFTITPAPAPAAPPTAPTAEE